MRLAAVFLAGLCGVMVVEAEAQQAPPLTRAAALAAAFATNPRIAAARADSAAAAARIVTAGVLPDPTLSASYTKDIPQYHVTVEMPLDQLWLRGSRVGAAKASQLASIYKLRYEIASLALDVDTAYTRAVAAIAHLRFSTRNAQDADSLRRMVAARRDAGDASDLDVDLAALTAGQQANAAASDSVAAELALVTLNGLIGGSNPSALTLGDTLAYQGPAAPTPVSSTSAPLLVASSSAALESANLNARVQHRSVFGSPGVIVGFDTGDPKGETPGLLPVVGVAVPLPIFSRNRGPIAEAEAERARAAAELRSAQVESQLQITRARATLAAASSRIGRDQALVQTAERVAARSLTAYREGASTLASVLEAQRTARDVQTQYVDDVANVLVASATLRLLLLTPDSATP